VSWGRQRLQVLWHNFLPNFDVWNCFRHFFDSIRCSKDCYNGKFGHFLGLLLIFQILLWNAVGMILFRAEKTWFRVTSDLHSNFSFQFHHTAWPWWFEQSTSSKMQEIFWDLICTCTHVIVITTNRTCRHCYHAMCRLVWFCCVDATYAFRICSASLLKTVRNHLQANPSFASPVFADVVDHFWTHHRDR